MSEQLTGIYRQDYIEFPESWPFTSDLEAMLNHQFWQEINL